MCKLIIPSAVCIEFPTKFRQSEENFRNPVKCVYMYINDQHDICVDLVERVDLQGVKKTKKSLMWEMLYGSFRTTSKQKIMGLKSVLSVSFFKWFRDYKICFVRSSDIRTKSSSCKESFFNCEGYIVFIWNPKVKDA